MTEQWRIVSAGALSFLLVMATVPLARRVAIAHGLTDRPTAGKLHAEPTPYLGGVALAIGALASSVLLPRWQAEASIVFVGALVVSIVGLVDDVKNLSPARRVGIETFAAALAYASGARVHLFGGLPDAALTIAWLVIITNSFNLLDNMDGAMGSITAVVASSLAFVALANHQTLVGGLAVVTAAATIGFLVYNWHPAKIFMGDAGSLMLGYLLAVISLKLKTGVSHTASIVAVVLLVGPAVLDTTLVVISRRRAGRPLMVGGTDHTSHRLMRLGLRTPTVTVVLGLGTLYFTGLGMAVAQGVVPAGLAVLAGGGPAVLVLLWLLRMPCDATTARAIEPLEPAVTAT